MFFFEAVSVAVAVAVAELILQPLLMLQSDENI
jgi:hypothetical protein